MKTVVQIALLEPVVIDKYRWPWGNTYKDDGMPSTWFRVVEYVDKKTGELKTKKVDDMKTDLQDLFQFKADREFAETLTSIFKFLAFAVAIGTILGIGVWTQHKFKWIK
jgi:hypothetical protein